jgi:hypothetical protein
MEELELFYIFCDESIVEVDCVRRYLTAHVAVPAKAWNSIPNSQRSLTEPKNISRLHRIQKLLDDANGVAVIAYADVTPADLPLR